MDMSDLLKCECAGPRGSAWPSEQGNVLPAHRQYWNSCHLLKPVGSSLDPLPLAWTQILLQQVHCHQACPPVSDLDLADWRANVTVSRTSIHFPCTSHEGMHQSMFADLVIRSLEGHLDQDDHWLDKCPVLQSRGDCDAVHKILKVNKYKRY